MAITLKPVILKHNLRSDGTYNIKIRVTLNRKTAYIATEYYVVAKQLSPDLTTIKDEFILGEVNNDIRRLRNEVSKIGAKVNKYTAVGLASYLAEKRNPGTDNGIDFIAFSRDKIDKMQRSGRGATASCYVTAINKLTAYIHSSTLEIKDITVKFLRQYEDYLKENGVGSRGIESNLASIRALFNFAREEYNDEDLEEIKISHYPFAKFKIPKSDIPVQRSIRIEEVVKISRYSYSPLSKYDPKKEVSRPDLARDVFLLSFFLVGMNSKDLYDVPVSAYKNERLTYQRSKTKDRRRDKAEISIKIIPEAEEIISRYRDPEGVRLFSFYHRYSTAGTFNSNVNKGLKDIGNSVGIVDLEFYCARHTWATVARNECKVSTDDISLALNHTDMKMRVTEGYITKDFSLIDKANDKVANKYRKVSQSFGTASK